MKFEPATSTTDHKRMHAQITGTGGRGGLCDGSLGLCGRDSSAHSCIEVVLALRKTACIGIALLALTAANCTYTRNQSTRDKHRRENAQTRDDEQIQELAANALERRAARHEQTNGEILYQCYGGP